MHAPASASDSPRAGHDEPRPNSQNAQTARGFHCWQTNFQLPGRFCCGVLAEMYGVTDSTGWTAFLEFFGIFSIALGVLSSAPCSIRGDGNDAECFARR